LPATAPIPSKAQNKASAHNNGIFASLLQIAGRIKAKAQHLFTDKSWKQFFSLKNRCRKFALL
jgi:hypothetical protein